MNLDINDVLFKDEVKKKPINDYKTEEIKKEKEDNFAKVIDKVEDTNKSYTPNKYLGYILSLFLDFIIFGFLYILIYLLKNTVLIELAGEPSRVLVLNSITIIVILNIFLISYFYLFSKDHDGSTLSMKITGVKTLSKNGKVTLFSSMFSNIIFWIYFVLIDINLLNSIEGVNIYVMTWVLLALQIFILFLLNGVKISGMKLELNLKKEQNEK